MIFFFFDGSSLNIGMVCHQDLNHVSQIIVETYGLWNLQDRTVYSVLCRNWDPIPNQGRSQWFTKRCEDSFFLLIHSRKFLSCVGFYSSSSLDYVANTFQSMAPEIVSTFQFWSHWLVIPHWYSAPELEVKLSDEQLGGVAVCYSATVAMVLTYSHILHAAHLLCALATAKR